MILVQLLNLYSLVILGTVVASWIQLPPSNPIVNFLRSMTEPLLMPIRRVLPPLSGIDFSPLILFIAVRILRSLILSAGAGF